MENTSQWTEESSGGYIARLKEPPMQPIGQLVAQVIAVLRTKLDGSHINTYADRNETEDHNDSR